MADTKVELTNINMMTKEKFDSLTSIDDSQLYAVEFPFTDEDLVHTKYNETIDGTKTFLNNVYRKSSINSNKDTTRSANTYMAFTFVDKNGSPSGYIEEAYVNDGSRYFNIVVRNSEDTGVEVPFRIITPVYGSNSPSYVNCSGTWNFSSTIQGTAYRALWGDLAEYYKSDNNYPKGTLVQFGGEKEITIATEEVNAVITSEPGFILNTQDSFNDESSQAIALVGKVPVRVIGKCHKFDRLVLSNIPGVAISYDSIDENDESLDMHRNTYTGMNSNIIARALEEKTSDEEGLIICTVKFDIM